MKDFLAQYMPPDYSQHGLQLDQLNAYVAVRGYSVLDAVFAVPTVYQALLDHPRFAAAPLERVRHWGCGAKEARISQAAYRRFYYYLTGDERTGDIMHEVANSDFKTVEYDPMRLAQPITETLGTAIAVAILWVGARMVDSGAMDGSTLIAFLLIVMRTLQPLKQLSQTPTTAQQSFAAAEAAHAIGLPAAARDHDHRHIGIDPHADDGQSRTRPGHRRRSPPPPATRSLQTQQPELRRAA